ncbi:MAG: hypothetical protein LBQ12_08520 [Deltaproteobacteria bacterium]|jgi:hypothetical protein|nr:hypothetical protein [Deltaproteobacteria bacterium]
MDDLNVLCNALDAVKCELDGLAGLEKGLKERERELKDAILELMTEREQDSIRLANGKGTIYKRMADFVSFSDVTIGIRFMLDRMKEAEREGRPLIDQLITTKAVMKSNVVAWAEEELKKEGREITPNSRASKLAEIGIFYGTKYDVSLKRG